MESATDGSLAMQAGSAVAISAGNSELRLSNMDQLEMLRLMAEHGIKLRTMVRGFSMRPFIRDQDVLTIAPLNNQAPQIGEVVAFTHPISGRLVIHRIVERQDCGWIARGDNCQSIDGVISLENILGRIIRVERQGRDVRLGFGPERKWIAIINRGDVLFQLKKCWGTIRRIIGFALQRMQALSVYRAAGKLLIPPAVIAAATINDLEAAQHLLNPNAIHRKPTLNPNTKNWIAKHRGKIIGFVQLVYHPKDHFPWVGYWLFSLHVRTPYRGLGIGEKLSLRVLEQAENQGAGELFLTVYEDNERAIRLYRKLGFIQVVLPALEPLLASEKQQKGRRRIVLSHVFSEQKIFLPSD